MNSANSIGWVLLLTILLGTGSPVTAAEDDHAAAPAESTGKSGKKSEGKGEVATIPSAASRPVNTTNSVRVADEEVRYRTETGMLPLLKKDGEPRASVFYIAYTRLDAGPRQDRPVMFCFNGGPGSSSVWLHLGGLGPRRVVLNDDGSMPPPPFRLADNPRSILATTDLVFVDPVATGYSRPEKDEKPEQFFGQSPDIESLGEFIRLWTTRNERWLSPKYLCGESYGAFRGAGLARHLHERHGLYLNGLVLLSGLLDFATLREGPGNDLPSILFLPTLTATAHYHKRLPEELQADADAAIEASRRFARTDYALALLQGRTLPQPEFKAIAAQLARFTGLPQSLIEDHRLQVSSSVFREHLLRDQDLIVGRFDARLTARDGDRASSNPLFDPSYAQAYGPFSAAMNAYLREELLFTNDLPYEILAGVGPWQFDAKSSYPSVAGQLATVMSQNPHLRVLILHGLRDLACPVDGTRYSIDHLSIDPSLRANITWAEYESGHMMYVNLPDLEKLQRDLQAFLKP